MALGIGLTLAWNTTPGRTARRALGWPVPPRSPLYFTYGGGVAVIDGGKLRIFAGSSHWSLALAVSQRLGIRLMPSYPPWVPGAWFRLDGTPVAPVVDSGPSLCCYYDGTTDGRFNYAIRQDTTQLSEPIGSRPLAPPAIHRFDLDWRNRELLFALGEPSQDVTSRMYYGLAYDGESDAFWVTRREPNSSVYAEHWSRNGRRLTTFPLAAESRAIAVDPADGTVWLLRYGPNDDRLHFQNVDRTGRSLGTYTIPRPLTVVGNVGLEFAWPAEK
jgi:hypothetical protein